MANTTVNPFGTGGQLPSSIGVINDLFTGGVNKAWSAEMGKEIAGVIFSQIESPIDISLLVVQNCSLSSDKMWNYRNSLGKHIAIPTSEGKTYRIKANNGNWYGWVTSAYAPPYANGVAVPYANQSDRTWTADATITAPEETAFLILCTQDGSGNNTTWEVTGGIPTTDKFTAMQEEIDAINEKIDTTVTNEIDLDDITSQKGTLGNGTWYTTKGYHKAIKVKQGASYKLLITASGLAGGYYGWLTDDYSIPVVSGATIPFASNGSRLWLNSLTVKNVTPPEDAEWLVISVVDGSGNDVTWDNIIETYDNTPDFDKINQRMEELDGVSKGQRLRVCSWNVGHFSLGTTSDTTITAENYDEMKTKWRTAINTINADMMLLVEYNTNFAKNPDVTAETAIFSLFKDKKIGTKSGYNQSAMYGNRGFSNTQQVVYEHAVQDGRYYLVSDVKVGDTVVKFVVTHLDFNQGEHGAEYRAEQIQKLIADFTSYDHVVICGDFNVAPASDYEAFTNAGYTMANHGYLGDILTWPAGAGTNCFDNIIVKGFAINGIKTLDDATLSDHAAIYCDLMIL